MATRIPPDFAPDDRSYNNLAKHGAIRDFVDSQIDYFTTYWNEQAEKGVATAKKASWQMTFQRWMRSAWNGKTGREWEKSRHYQTRSQSKGNPFELALEGLQAGETPPIQPQTPRKAFIPVTVPKDYAPPIEANAPTMTSEQAFAELRKML